MKTARVEASPEFNTLRMNKKNHVHLTKLERFEHTLDFNQVVTEIQTCGDQLVCKKRTVEKLLEFYKKIFRDVSSYSIVDQFLKNFLYIQEQQ